MKKTVIKAVLLFLTGASCAASAPDMVRLYPSLQPKDYDLDLRVDPAKGTFVGTVAIHAQWMKASSRLQLHSIGLDIRKATVNGHAIDQSGISYDKDRELVTFDLGKELHSGPVAITLEYRGNLNEQMQGLYASTAKNHDKVERYAFTQFEATDFRRMVPSVDEPEAKAVFSIQITAPKDLVVLSNSSPTERSVSGGWQTVHFKPSPKMSTYLVALAIARLSKKTAKVGKTEINVYTLPWDINKADFALAEQAKVLAWYNNYYGIPYPLEKLDLVAVPDFSAGAMENWGMITFRDSTILLDPKTASIQEKRRVAEVVYHEIAHQWFGDLVTMEWWNDLWLNEAFATFMANKAAEALHPEWNVIQDFDSGRRSALWTDSLKNSRSIAFDVRTTGQIDEMFDVLTYEKGASVLRMIEQYLGADVFRQGIRSYLKKHAYRNARTEGLWASLSEASQKEIGPLARTWINQPGYPLVSVEPGNRPGQATLKQTRWFADGGSDSSLWQVPVRIKYQLEGESQPRVTQPLLLKDKEMPVNLDGNKRVVWAYPNVQEVGVYRSALSPDFLRQLLPAAATALEPLERTGLLDHLWFQTRGGRIPIQTYLDALGFFKAEKDRAVLETMAGHVSTLFERMARPADRPALERMVTSLFSGPLQALGWEPTPKEGDDPRLARAAVLATLGSFSDDEAVKNEIKKRLGDYLDAGKESDPTLTQALIIVGARLGDEILFDKYKERMLSAKTPQEGLRYLRALAEFRDEKLGAKLQEMTLAVDPSTKEPLIRGQNLGYVYSGLLRNPSTQIKVAEMTLVSWDAVHKKAADYGATHIIGAFSPIWNSEWQEKIGKFFAEEKYAARTLAQTVETMGLGEQFVRRQSPGLSEWLSKH